MKTTTSIASHSHTGEAKPPINMDGFPYKTIAIYPNFSDVGGALASLKNAGFTSDQISLLGREQEHWKEQLGAQWQAMNTATGALEGAAFGAIPGLVLVAGVALTGGVGLLAVGPMAVALEALGLGVLGGSLIGGVANNIDSAEKTVNVEAEVEDAIGRGQWVIVAHSYDEAEALRAQALLHDSRIVRGTESDARPH